MGLWREADSQQLWEALRVLGLDRFRILYWDDPGVPDKYRERRPRRPQLDLFREGEMAASA